MPGLLACKRLGLGAEPGAVLGRKIHLNLRVRNYQLQNYPSGRAVVPRLLQVGNTVRRRVLGWWEPQKNWYLVLERVVEKNDGTFAPRVGFGVHTQPGARF